MAFQVGTDGEVGFAEEAEKGDRRERKQNTGNMFRDQRREIGLEHRLLHIQEKWKMNLES